MEVTSTQGKQNNTVIYKHIEQFYNTFLCTEKDKVSVLQGCLVKSVSFKFSKKLETLNQVSIKIDVDQEVYYFTLKFADLKKVIATRKQRFSWIP